ncbi:hypothetical protein HOY80DRAFT_541429 [Tuber brumale]|nr:hypothetical protein HOY80DRAFT_541429 [Tuber brumale]
MLRGPSISSAILAKLTLIQTTPDQPSRLLSTWILSLPLQISLAFLTYILLSSFLIVHIFIKLLYIIVDSNVNRLTIGVPSFHFFSPVSTDHLPFILFLFLFSFFLSLEFRLNLVHLIVFLAPHSCYLSISTLYFANI